MSNISYTTLSRSAPAPPPPRPVPHTDLHQLTCRLIARESVLYMRAMHADSATNHCTHTRLWLWPGPTPTLTVLSLCPWLWPTFTTTPPKTVPVPVAHFSHDLTTTSVSLWLSVVFKSLLYCTCLPPTPGSKTLTHSGASAN